MNLDSLTPGQRESVECVDGPLLVSAGAGSGKTFMLTQRIAYALSPASGPAVTDIGEVLAITFTEKAAAEIKARVKRTLRQEGRTDQALKVDAAWISTIHGACARILRTHALEIGLDPAFSVVVDAERADMIAQSINEALGRRNDIIGRRAHAALFAEYAARSKGRASASVSSMVKALIDRATGLRHGLDDLAAGPAPAHPQRLARELLQAYEDVAAVLEQAGGSPTAQTARADAAEALEALGTYLLEAPASGPADGPDAALSAFAQVMDGCAVIPKKFGSATVKAAVGDFQAVYARVAQDAMLGLAAPLQGELIELARDASARYEQKKRACCALDNDDLLVRALDALEQVPALSARYAGRFKLVMVDEFQDTSQLQIDLIGKLAGENCAHLCTVGDAQQSIYRFRGADVNVYEAHKRTMRAPGIGARYVELARNFRSHGDVLAFVDRIFEQPHVFGDAFMPLEPNPARRSGYCGSAPRIDVVMAMQPAGLNTGVGIADAKRAEAAAIAERFAALREDGHKPGDMVVLLGKMPRAGVFAEALRAAGFECVIAGGSMFSGAPEVRLVSRLAQAVANPANTAALFEVMSSDMMHLSADDFLMLSTEVDGRTGSVSRRDLDRGFAQLAARAGELPPRLGHAVALLDRARNEARTHSMERAVRRAVVESGWMARLEGQGADGLACAANVLKAVRLLGRLERERHLGPASCARAFAHELDTGLKEAPGALSADGGDVVKIMTIHASKGLEFPLVAVADFANTGHSAGKLLVEAAGGAAFASLAPGATAEAFPNLAKRAAAYPAGAQGEDEGELAAAERALEAAAGGGMLGAAGAGAFSGIGAAAFREALGRRIAREELAEARRKLYVALTRASEALIVTMCGKAPAAGKQPSYPPLVDDIRSALFGAGDFPEGTSEVAFGGSSPARVTRLLVTPAGEGAAGAPGAEGAPDDASADGADHPGAAAVREFLVPCIEDSPAALRAADALRSDVFSYSSIAPHTAPARKPAEPAATEASDRGSESPGSVAYDAEEVDRRARLAEWDKATGLGSAFHRAAQYAVETGRVPDKDRVAQIAYAYRLGEEACGRLDAALTRWFASADYARVRTFARRRAEVPFFVRVGGAFLEGEIDLLCEDGPDAPALVIDYKTGGAPDETSEQLHARHELQAQCYAYALLSQGAPAVELRFERVEQSGLHGEPQVVAYRYAAEDLPALEDLIAQARRAAIN